MVGHPISNQRLKTQSLIKSYKTLKILGKIMSFYITNKIELKLAIKTLDKKY